MRPCELEIVALPSQALTQLGQFERDMGQSRAC